MGIGIGFYTRNILAQEIRKRIAFAWLNAETLSIPKQADQIASLYPGSGLPDEDLRNRLFADATGVGLPVKLTRETVKPRTDTRA
jgi:hypothetical protein